jgi:hypothetical protein
MNVLRVFDFQNADFDIRDIGGGVVDRGGPGDGAPVLLVDPILAALRTL